MVFHLAAHVLEEAKDIGSGLRENGLISGMADAAQAFSLTEVDLGKKLMDDILGLSSAPQKLGRLF